jgi:hypothetical protein
VSTDEQNANLQQWLFKVSVDNCQEINKGSPPVIHYADNEQTIPTLQNK